MMTYRGISYDFKNKHFIHFYNPNGSYHFKETGYEGGRYGRDYMIRSFPENCKLTPEEFAKTVIDHLYDRHDTYKRNEKRLFYVAKSNRNLKNLCK